MGATAIIRLWDAAVTISIFAVVTIITSSGNNFPRTYSSVLPCTLTEINPQISYVSSTENISSHIRKLGSTRLFELVHSLAGTSSASGFFYTEYYSKPNCSSGAGTVSYVEGYATGICLQISGQKLSSMIQTCQSSGMYLPWRKPSEIVYKVIYKVPRMSNLHHCTRRDFN